MPNENQPRTADGRFGTVAQLESDVELTADDQLPEWQVLELARPGGKTHTVRAADPGTARERVLDDLGITVEGVRQSVTCLFKVTPAGQQDKTIEDEKDPELKGWHLEFTVTPAGGGRGASYQTTVQAPDPESAKLAVYDRHAMNLWQRVTAEKTMVISQVIQRSLYPVR